MKDSDFFKEKTTRETKSQEPCKDIDNHIFLEPGKQCPYCKYTAPKKPYSYIEEKDLKSSFDKKEA